MARSALEIELDRTLAALAGRHDVLPFMATLYPASVMLLKPLPQDMLGIIEKSPDYRPLAADGKPVWPQLVSEEGHAELIVCRAGADGHIYVVTPREDHRSGNLD